MSVPHTSVFVWTAVQQAPVCLCISRRGFILPHTLHSIPQPILIQWDNLWERQGGSMLNGVSWEVPESTHCTP